MSHDIPMPVNAISGLTELALMEKNPERTVEYLNNIQSSGKFPLGIVYDILGMNKVEAEICSCTLSHIAAGIRNLY